MIFRKRCVIRHGFSDYTNIDFLGKLTRPRGMHICVGRFLSSLVSRANEKIRTCVFVTHTVIGRLCASPFRSLREIYRRTIRRLIISIINCINGILIDKYVTTIFDILVAMCTHHCETTQQFRSCCCCF